MTKIADDKVKGMIGAVINDIHIDDSGAIITTPMGRIEITGFGADMISAKVVFTYDKIATLAEVYAFMRGKTIKNAYTKSNGADFVHEFTNGESVTLRGGTHNQVITQIIKETIT